MPEQVFLTRMTVISVTGWRIVVKCCFSASRFFDITHERFSKNLVCYGAPRFPHRVILFGRLHGAPREFASLTKFSEIGCRVCLKIKEVSRGWLSGSPVHLSGHPLKVILQKCKLV